MSLIVFFTIFVNFISVLLSICFSFCFVGFIVGSALSIVLNSVRFMISFLVRFFLSFPFFSHNSSPYDILMPVCFSLHVLQKVTVKWHCNRAIFLNFNLAE